MSGDGSVTRLWGDGEHRFRLRIGELRQLEEKRDSGCLEIWLRLGSGKWRIDDIFEVLRLGLIGGGMAPPLALGLVAKYVTNEDFFAQSLAAREVLAHALFGSPDDPVGKMTAAATTTTATTAAGPNGQTSSVPAQQSDGQSPPSMNVHSGNSQRLSMDGANAMEPTSLDRGE
jgi:hypothetical protein